tara:strand:- start:75 stop:455 length:381 start_codon:yes stop_codon:yes gene_type:complete
MPRKDEFDFDFPTDQVNILPLATDELVEKLRVSRERKSKKNKELGLISRTGNRRCGYGLKFPETNPNLSNLVLYYKKMKDMDTMKPLTNTQISKLLLREYNLSVSDESVGKILEDIEGEPYVKNNR